MGMNMCAELSAVGGELLFAVFTASRAVVSPATFARTGKNLTTLSNVS